jgi:hypothetical protein
MTDRRNRELVLSRLRELPAAYEAFEHQVARGGSVQVPSRGEPPIPIPTAVLDLMTDFETQILRLHSRALVVLGWHLPPVKLAREGQYIACPVPGCGAPARHAAGPAGRAGRGPLPRYRRLAR